MLFGHDLFEVFKHLEIVAGEDHIIYILIEVDDLNIPLGV